MASSDAQRMLALRTQQYLKTLHRKIASRRQKVRNLHMLALRPGHSPEKLEFLRNLERGAAGSVKGWQKAPRTS
jgi:hypothetical protein